MQLFMEIREAREAYNHTRKEAAPRLGCGDRTLEAYEYCRAETPLVVYRNAAEEYHSPEILDRAYEKHKQEWPRVPLPQQVEPSLYANAAKAVKEAKEVEEACSQLITELYGKASGTDLTPADRGLIERAVVECAESVQAFKKLCLVLVKQYGYSMAEIDKIIARGVKLNGRRKNTV